MQAGAAAAAGAAGARPRQGSAAASANAEPAASRDEGAGLVSSTVAFLEKPYGRFIVALAWLLLILGGLLATPRFMAILESTVPPVKGSPSQEAFDASNHYFPNKALTNAFLCESVDKSPFVDFAEASTCRLEHSLDRSGGQLKVAFSCGNASAPGGGCIRSSDLAAELAEGMEAILQELHVPPAEAARLLQMLNSTVLPVLRQNLPEILQCPVPPARGGNEDWLALASDINASLASNFPQCKNSVLSLASVPPESVERSFPLGLVNLTVAATLPAGTFWGLFGDELLSEDHTTMLIVASSSGCQGWDMQPAGKQAKDLAKSMEDVAAQAPKSIRARVSSQTSMFDAILGGIQQTMDLSSKTLPVALVILALMVGNLRLIICTLVNLVACIASAILFMYPIAKCVTVSTTAPSMMIAVALGMSIDYSLFLLTRFQKEAKLGKPAGVAVEVMLKTSGKIVLVSGFTLLVCFLMMLSLPVSLISMMGVSASITVFTAIAAALLLTPITLLTFPVFFSSDRRWGLSSDGCCCRRRETGGDAREAGLGQRLAEATGGSGSGTEVIPAGGRQSCWPTFGRAVQRFSPLILVALVAVAVPFAAFSLPKLGHTAGLVPFMPTDAEVTRTVLDLQDAFGVGALYPTTLLLVPPRAAVATEENRTHWLKTSCESLQAIARAVDTDPAAPAFTADVFSGVMIISGRCTDLGMGKWSDVGGPYSATQVLINYQIDPFSTQGQQWLSRLRTAVEDYKHVAEWYIAGEGPNQMDAADMTFARFPLMIVLMMIAVMLLIGVAFKSVVAPLRAVFCLLWMLAMTFGLAIFVFQDGWFSFLDWSQLGRRASGAMSWMSPCIACSVVIGLGLDYDIFYTESVVEERAHGHDEKGAALIALADTANTISAAGMIMAIAFGALLLCSIPTLNEIAFLLVVGILIDCFVNTKIIMPAAMALLGRYNFWPRQFKPMQQHGDPRRNLVEVA